MDSLRTAPHVTRTWSPISPFLIALMAIGSVVMWIGVPVGLIYLASRLADSSKPSMGPYVLILVGLAAGMMAVGKLLGALDRSTAGSPASTTASRRRPRGCTRCAATASASAAARCSTA